MVKIQYEMMYVRRIDVEVSDEELNVLRSGDWRETEWVRQQVTERAMAAVPRGQDGKDELPTWVCSTCTYGDNGEILFDV